jgi:DNA-binding NarL/FixJ family response regulator
MAKVLLAEHDAPLGHSVLHRLGRLDIAGEWVRSASELEAWAALLHRGQQLDPARGRALEPRLVLLDWELPGAAAGAPLGVLEGLLPSAIIVVLSEGLSGDDAAVLLSRGVPSIHKPVHPFVLSTLALDLATESAPMVAGTSIDFENLVAAYAASRRLSKQQALILDLYLSGKSDKEIAGLCACSGATVYEHWRRMARKSGGRQKSDIIADFHRYLRGTPPDTSGLGTPSARAAIAAPSAQLGIAARVAVVSPATASPPAFVENFGLG